MPDAIPNTVDFGPRDWKSLRDFIEQWFGEGFANNGFVFRGESKPYPKCLPLIDRLLPSSMCMGEADRRLDAELQAMLRFRQLAPMHLDTTLHPILVEGMQIQVVMRHYGAPTRLLDWTESPWVGLFFACDDAVFSGDGPVEPGRLRAFDRRDLEAVVRQKYSKESQTHAQMSVTRDGLTFPRMLDSGFVQSAHDWVVAYHRHAGTFPRLIAQQGLFTIGSKPWLDHWDTIRSLCPDRHTEIRIAPELKFKILRHLMRMGITAASLFVSAEGVAAEVCARTRLLHGDDYVTEGDHSSRL